MPSTPVVVLDSTLTNIANAIRSKTGGSATMKPGQMPAQIAAIPTGSGEGIPREVDANGVYGMPTQSFTFSLPTEATSISGYALSNAFRDCTALTSVNLSSLTTVSNSYALFEAFKYCTNLTSVNLSSLTTVSGSYALSNTFNGCTSLTSVDLSPLTTISATNAFSEAFKDCTGLTSVNLSSLTTMSSSNIFSNAFNGCTNLTSLSFPALTTSSFGSRTNQFNGMLIGCSNVTVHFPASIESTIGSWSSVTSGFGGTNTTVLFDL